MTKIKTPAIIAISMAFGIVAGAGVTAVPAAPALQGHVARGR